MDGTSKFSTSELEGTLSKMHNYVSFTSKNIIQYSLHPNYDMIEGETETKFSEKSLMFNSTLYTWIIKFE